MVFSIAQSSFSSRGRPDALATAFFAAAAVVSLHAPLAAAGLATCSGGKYVTGLTATVMSGTCESNGQQSMASAAECQVASSGIDTLTWGGTASTSIRPTGCYKWSSNVYFNTYSGDGNSCGKNGWPCVCFQDCADCPAGKFSDAAGQTSCKGTCGEGQYSPGGLASCIACSRGQYQDERSKGSCENCSSGQYQDETGQSVPCETCAKGQYQDETSKGSCETCATGQYQDETGQSVPCETCSKGQYQDETGQSVPCETCASGQYQDETGQSVPCENCSSGQYQDETSKGSCEKCASGQYQGEAGKSTCRQCNQGKFASSTGWSECQDCAQSSFSDELGSTTCKFCSEVSKTLTYTESRGAASQSECRLPPGGGPMCPGLYEEEDRTTGKCVCSAGTAKSTIVQVNATDTSSTTEQCTPCLAGTHRPLDLKEEKCLVCPAGTWAPNTSTYCHVCPRGTANDKRGATALSACVICPGTVGNRTCPAGSSVPLTDDAANALEAARKESRAGQLERIVGADVLGTASGVAPETTDPERGGRGIIPDSAFYSSGSALAALALIIIALHRLLPKWFYTRIDAFANDHHVNQGESPVKRRTQLGSAFTVAFLPIAVAVALALYRANKNVVTEALSLPLDQVPAKTDRFQVRLSSPLAFGNISSGGCGGITLDSFEGIECKTPAQLKWSPSICIVDGRSCELGQIVKVVFKIPIEYKAAAFSVGSTAAIVQDRAAAFSGGGSDGQFGLVKGTVASPSGDEVLTGNTVVKLQSLATYVQDNTTAADVGSGSSGSSISSSISSSSSGSSSGGGYPLPSQTNAETSNIYSGYQLSQAPNVDALAVSSALANSSPTVESAWRLEIRINRLPTALKTVITQGQDGFQLMAAIIALAGTLFGIWRLVFGRAEKMVTWLQKRNKCCRRGSRAAGPALAGPSRGHQTSDIELAKADSRPASVDVDKKEEEGTEATGALPTDLAADWTSHQDPTTGAAYYCNERTRSTTWTEPSSGNSPNGSGTTRADLDTVNPMVGVQASQIIARLTARVAEAEAQIREMRAEAAYANEHAAKAEQQLGDVRADAASANKRASTADARAAKAEQELKDMRADVAERFRSMEAAIARANE